MVKSEFFETLVIKEGFLGGKHEITFIVEKLNSKFKIGVICGEKKKFLHDSFCDYENAFGLCSNG